MDLHDAQNKIFLAVGPSRIATLTLAALCARIKDGAEDERAGEIVEMSFGRIRDAYQMLQGGIDDLMRAADYQLSPELQKKRRLCTAALRPFHDLVAEGGTKCPDMYGTRDLSGAALLDLEPKVSDFLADLVQDFQDAQAKRDEKQNKELRKLVSDVNGLGKGIQLIAFNASVEAARVGEQGQGFAVIASEVRNLAANVQKTMSGLLEKLSQQADKA